MSANRLPTTWHDLPALQRYYEGGGDKSGFGDTLQSLFFSPKAPTSGGWIWGAGPVVLLPTGTEGFSARKWAAGPTALLL